jgi:hypothetical protein
MDLISVKPDLQIQQAPKTLSVSNKLYHFILEIN